MTKIENAAEFLRSTGLLMEINRVVLHPRGLALSVDCPSVNEPATRFGPLLDARDDPEGFIFGDGNGGGFAESAGRLRAAERDGRCPVSPAREKCLGYVVQPLPVTEGT
jgi:hypothetical protein